MNTLGDLASSLDCKILVAHETTIEDMTVILNKLSELRGDIPFYREKIDNIWDWLAACGVPIDTDQV